VGRWGTRDEGQCKQHECGEDGKGNMTSASYFRKLSMST
jgi:hypothetical protein